MVIPDEEVWVIFHEKVGVPDEVALVDDEALEVDEEAVLVQVVLEADEEVALVEVEHEIKHRSIYL